MDRPHKPYPYSGRNGSRDHQNTYPSHNEAPRDRPFDDYGHQRSSRGRGRGGRGGSWAQPRSGRGLPPNDYHSPNRSNYRSRSDSYTQSHTPYPSSRPRNPNRTHLGPDPTFKSGPVKYPRKSEKEQREFPCRCLFVRNIEKYEANERDIHELFSAYGEIKMIVDKIFDSGVAYISFFDLRAAESARTHLNGTSFKGRPLDVHFAFPNPNSDRTEPPPPKENQGSIKLVFRGFLHMPPHDQMYDFFSQFGQVRDIHHTNNPNVYILSYYDCRACMEVVRNTPADAFGEGTVLADLAWDKFLPIPLEEQHSRGGIHQPSYQGNNFSSAPYGYKEPYSHNPSGTRTDFSYQPYNETPSNTQDLIEKAQQAQELLNYIQTQTTIKLPESTSYYNSTAQSSHSDKTGVYYQNTPSSYTPTESQGYYPPTTPAAASQYNYSPAQTHSGQSNYYPSNPNSNPAPQSYSSGKSTHTDNTYGYYAPPQDVSSNCYQSTSNLPVAPQENAPNTEVNQLLQLLAQANSKHSIK